MVKAILAGKKTKTRRVITPQPEIGDQDVYEAIKRKCPYGNAGDTLWVRETWGAQPAMMGGICPDTIRYRADGEYRDEHNVWKWRPSIYLPQKYSRIILEIINVWIDQIQNITEEDAKAEGVQPYASRIDSRMSYIEGFRREWERLNKKRGYGWDINPLVWVIGFKRVE